MLSAALEESLVFQSNQVLRIEASFKEMRQALKKKEKKTNLDSLNRQAADPGLDMACISASILKSLRAA